MNIKILSCFHKEFERPNSNVIYPIHVGKDISDLELNILQDNEGDNISNKNPNYCELTAMYWAWKNIKCDIIGITHYRRYFDFRNSKLKYKLINNENEFILGDTMFYNYETHIKNIFNNGYDVILTKKCNYPVSVKKQYLMGHIKEDLDILENIVLEIYPEYEESYKRIFEKSNSIHAYNMMIMKKDQFDEYCNWLFRILFEVEKRIYISQYRYQARVFGFMAERLLNVYIDYHNLKIKQTPVLFINDNKNESMIKENLRYLKNNMKFKILENI